MVTKCFVWTVLLDIVSAATEHKGEEEGGEDTLLDFTDWRGF
jgi:hypothetical protein